MDSTTPQTERPGPAPTRAPAVWPWYIAFCVLLTLTYAAVVVGCVAVLQAAPAQLVPKSTDPVKDAGNVKLSAALLLAFFLLLCLAAVAGPFLPKKPWAWIYGFILICIGMFNVCCLPAAFPLLFFWLREETQCYFGRTPRELSEFS